MKVFINPGHAPDGNPDPGACGNGLRECDVVAKIGQKLEKYLVAAGVEVVGNLQDDSLAMIVNTANASDADVFVSIHCNSHNNPAANGTETWYYTGSAKGEKLAECINRQIRDALAVTNRGTKSTTVYYVLKHTNMTAVLVETAFISNEDDAYLLENHTDDFARAIARGITDFQQVM